MVKQVKTLQTGKTVEIIVPEGSANAINVDLSRFFSNIISVGLEVNGTVQFSFSDVGFTHVAVGTPKADLYVDSANVGTFSLPSGKAHSNAYNPPKLGSYGYESNDYTTLFDVTSNFQTIKTYNLYFVDTSTSSSGSYNQNVYGNITVVKLIFTGY